MKKTALYLLFAFFLPLAAAEAPNMMKNPRFEQTPLDWQFRVMEGNKGKISWKIIEDSSVAGKTLHLSTAENEVTKDGNWMSQTVTVKPQFKYVLEFSVKAFAHNNDLDHSVSAGAAFLTGTGGWISYKSFQGYAKYSEKWKSKSPGKNQWERVKYEFTTPPGAEKVMIRLNISGAGAEAFFADFKLTSPTDTTADKLDEAAIPAAFNARLRPVSAAGITLTPDWTLADAEKLQSRTREQLCLNGLWAFLIPGKNGELAQEPKWSFFKVPGRPGDSRNPFEIYGNNGYEWNQSNFRWLYRTVAIPADAPRRTYSIRIDSLLGAGAKLLWNGKEIGKIIDSWGGEVEIPAELIRYGEENVLAILLAGKKLNETTIHLILAGKVPDLYEPSYSANIGNVYLMSRPAGDICRKMRIVPSWRNKTLTVRIPGAKGAEQLSYTITVRDSAGKTVLESAASTPKAAGKRLALTVPWQNPVEWNPATPNLLFLTLTAVDSKGALIDQSLPERFGFRELWVEGRDIKLNGKTIRLRPRNGLHGGGTFVYRDYAEKGFAFLKDMGFNTLYRCGTERGEADLVRIADEVGFLCVSYLPTALADGGQFGDLKTQPIDDTLLDYLDSHQIERFHNNPSLIHYSGFGAMMPLDQSTKYANHPALWGIKPINSDAVIQDLIRRKVTSDTGVLRRQAAIISFIRGIRNLDPSRPFLNHVGCGTGDGWGSYDYFNWLPLQEWEDYVIDWTRRGVQPIGSTEHGHPYPQSFVNHGVPDGDAEPWHTEYIAGRLGPEAYSLERPGFRELIRKIYDPKTKTFRAPGRHGHSAGSYTNQEPAVQKLWAENTRRIYRAWRLYGVSMGIEPFGASANYIRHDVVWGEHRKVIATDSQFLKQTGGFPDRFLQNDYFTKESFPSYPNQPTGKMPENMLTPLGEALYRYNREFLGFIVDAKERPTAKTHIYAPGEQVRKNLALVWDGFGDAKIEVRCEVELEGRQLTAFTRTVDLKQCQILLEELNFTIPAETRGSLELPGRGTVKAAFLKEGRELCNDEFPFSIVGTPAKIGRRVALYDPADTAGAVKSFAAVTARNAPELAKLTYDLLVVAPGALDNHAVKAAKPGVPVIVLAQPESTLVNLGFITHPIRSRQLWADDSLKVDSELLRDWRAGRPFEKEEETKPWREGHNNYIGSTGMVAGVLMEVPHFGNYTPLVHGEFDMALTALLETEVNGSPYLFCQLTLPENAGIDPAAKALTAKLLDEFGRNIPKRRPVRVIGDEALPRMLLATVAAESELVFAEKLDARQAETLLTQVRNGATAILLPQTDEVYRKLGIAFERSTGAYFPGEIRGLNPGDFHFRQDLPVVTFDGKIIAGKAEGKGTFVLCGFDPRSLNPGKEPYLMLTARRQYRTLTQLVINAGGAFDSTNRSLHSRLSTAPFNHVFPLEAAHPIRATREGDGWEKPEFKAEQWQGFPLRQTNTGLIDAQLRIGFRLDSFPGEPLVLDAGSFDDFDECYLNGVKIGEVTPANSDPEQAWKTRRVYPIPAGLLKKGDNLLAIRVWNRNGTTKGWNAQVRGPLSIRRATEEAPPYFGKYRNSDDPYQLRQW